jgi:hypothetical protein
MLKPIEIETELIPQAIIVAVVSIGNLHAFSSLVAVAILSGTVKAAYSAVQIALMIAAVRGAIKTAAKVRRAGRAVIRHADATKQKWISSIGQLSPAGLLLRPMRCIGQESHA